MLKTRLQNQNGSINLFKHFLKNPVKVGAIAPSSKRLSREMVADLQIDETDIVLELGPGTGSFTKLLYQMIPNKKNYLGIEREPKFVKSLQTHCPDFSFVVGNAEDAKQICTKEDIHHIKYIISSIPFANFPKPMRDRIIASLKNIMNPGSIFRTYQYAHAFPFLSAIKFRQKMDQTFGGHHRSKVIMRNLPPAFVLSWTL